MKEFIPTILVFLAIFFGIGFITGLLSEGRNCAHYDRIIKLHPGFILGCELVRERDWWK